MIVDEEVQGFAKVLTVPDNDSILRVSIVSYNAFVLLSDFISREA